ncbi:MAG TPA: hypothetical protein VHC47_05965 [Mucilaginibacter sp.]|nr:hypothetical protein [Mucilaginibacter sp.]
MSEYLDPEDESFEDNQTQQTHKDSSPRKHKDTLETRGPARDKNFKVLRSDGGLAHHLPDAKTEGSGAQEGTIGRSE